MIAVADSGSTTIDWRILRDDLSVEKMVSPGINPVYQSTEEIMQTLSEVVGKMRDGECSHVYFYGAGLLSPDTCARVTAAIGTLLPGCRVVAGSDLEAAALALLGDGDGIAAILGTGSNSGLYIGGRIVRSVPAGGFILGDEGSGAWLGKRLLSDYIKGLLPDVMDEAFRKEFPGLDYPAVVERVYRDAMPSRYLASFSPFLERHRGLPYVKDLLQEGFGLFIRRNILSYGRPDLPLAVVGSVAEVYREELAAAALKEGIGTVRVEAGAGDGLVRYFQRKTIGA